MSLQVQRQAQADLGVPVRVVDLRWLNPLPLEAVDMHAREAAGVLVVDECRATGGGIAGDLVSHLAEAGYGRPLASVRAADSFVPLGPAANTVLVGTGEIRAALETLLERINAAAN